MPVRRSAWRSRHSDPPANGEVPGQPASYGPPPRTATPPAAGTAHSHSYCNTSVKSKTFLVSKELVVFVSLLCPLRSAQTS